MMRAIPACLTLLLAATAVAAPPAAACNPCPWDVTVTYHPTDLIRAVSFDPTGPFLGYVGLVHIEVAGTGFPAAGFGATSPCDLWDSIGIRADCIPLTAEAVYEPSLDGKPLACVSWAYLGIDAHAIPGPHDDVHTDKAVHVGTC